MRYIMLCSLVTIANDDIFFKNAKRVDIKCYHHKNDKYVRLAYTISYTESFWDIYIFEKS
jgi:hypothetical protein